MPFEIALTAEAEDFIKKCDKVIRNRITKSLRRLENEPESEKPLTSILSGLWSLRIEDYRAIYKIKNSELIFVVIKVGHRKDKY